jgi:hypothetical protein
MFLESKVRPVRGADNLTAIYEPIVWTVGIALLFYFYRCSFLDTEWPTDICLRSKFL